MISSKLVVVFIKNKCEFLYKNYDGDEIKFVQILTYVSEFPVSCPDSKDQ
jgi:hypothetical protein